MPRLPGACPWGGAAPQPLQTRGGTPCMPRNLLWLRPGAVTSSISPSFWTQLSEPTLAAALGSTHGLPSCHDTNRAGCRAQAAGGSSLHSRLGIPRLHGSVAAPWKDPGAARQTLQPAAYSGSSLPSGDAHADAHAQPKSTRRISRRKRIESMFEAAVFQYEKFSVLAGQFMPMVTLFFLLAFVNTILDSLKDTLVITAAGGGAEVIPYLTVYAVLPSSLMFLLIYSAASQHFTRSQLFNGIVSAFMSFFLLFAYVLYPNHQTLHPNLLADDMAKLLPSGLAGLVGMLRNWTFTLFFCMSELWGDVCLGLLFWGLANDTTSLSDAHTLYPLFGLGANVAQAIAGLALKLFSGSGSFTYQIQSLTLLVLGLSVAAMVLYGYVQARDLAQKAVEAKRRQQRTDARQRQRVEQQQQQELLDAEYLLEHAGDDGVEQMSVESASSAVGTGAREHAHAGTSTAHQDGDGSAKPKPTIQEIFRTLARSVPIQCLAVMSLAQGLCSNLMEFAWKSHIGLLYPTPGEFTNFLGDVSTWQGVITGGLMILSPAMFARMGWKEVASATPQMLLVGGSVFFASCITYQMWFAGTWAGAASGPAPAMLVALVYGGALLYVLTKSAKFSLFKPAEEMVYISLDEESRTKGKAAIDVVGSQAGKSGGSILQQVLLLLSSGTITGSLPIMCGVYLLMVNGWIGSVSRLSEFNPRYGHPDSVHPTLSTVDLDASDDEEEEKRRAEEVEQMLIQKRVQAEALALPP